jgi:hypothetical protein
MRALIIPAAVAIAVLAATAPADALTPAVNAAVKAAATDVTPAAYYHRRYYRHGYYRRGGWVPPYLRGYRDPGYAYHGNINGCAVDLGYGRWESCNVGR